MVQPLADVEDLLVIVFIICGKEIGLLAIGPVDAIEWKKKEVARIDKDKCIKCLTCYDKCKFSAIM